MVAAGEAPRRGQPWTVAEAEEVVRRLTTWRLATIARRLGRSEKGVRHWLWRHRQAPTLQDLVTSGLAAELSGYTPQHLTALARAGRVRARRVPGGRWWLFEPTTLPRKRS